MLFCHQDHFRQAGSAAALSHSWLQIIIPPLQLESRNAQHITSEYLISHNHGLLVSVTALVPPSGCPWLTLPLVSGTLTQLFANP